MSSYCKIAAAKNLEELRIAIKAPSIDPSRSFAEEKRRIETHVKRQILARNHQTVLHEMVRRSADLAPEVQQLISDSKVSLWIS